VLLLGIILHPECVVHLCWLLGIEVRECNVVRLIERAFLLKHTTGSYHQCGSCNVYAQNTTYFYEEEVPFVLSLCTSIKQRVCLRLHALPERVVRWIKPLTTSFARFYSYSLARNKRELRGKTLTPECSSASLQKEHSDPGHMLRFTRFCGDSKHSG
jgi:hypothetical protein